MMAEQRTMAARKFATLNYQGWGNISGTGAGSSGCGNGDTNSGHKCNSDNEKSGSPSPTHSRILRSHTVTKAEAQAEMLAKKKKCTACENCGDTEDTKSADIILDDERTMVARKQAYISSRKMALYSTRPSSGQVFDSSSSGDECTVVTSKINKYHGILPQIQNAAARKRAQQATSQTANKKPHWPVVNQHHRSRSPVRRPGHCHCCTCTRSESPSPTRGSTVPKPALHFYKVKQEPLYNENEGEGIQVLNTPMKEELSSDEDVPSGRREAGPSGINGKGYQAQINDPMPAVSKWEPDMEPASAYSYKGSLIFLGQKDLGKERRKDFCLFCKKLTVRVREHMIEDHLDELDVRQAYQMEISGIKVKPWKFLAYHGNEEHNNKQALHNMDGFVIPCRMNANRKYLHEMRKCDLCQGWLTKGAFGTHKKCCPGIAWDSFSTKSGSQNGRK